LDLLKVYQGFAQSETDNLFSITPSAGDTNGSLAGKYFAFNARDFSGNLRRFFPYIVSGGVGDDPTAGRLEADSFTILGDSGGNMAARYFTIADGTSTTLSDTFFAYYMVNNSGTISGYDPRYGVPLKSSITVRGDTNGNLGGAYFTFKGGQGDTYYAWYVLDDATTLSADPRLGQNEATIIRINRGADTTLNGTYFTFSTPTQNYFAWYTNGNGINPRLGRAQVQTFTPTGADTFGTLAGRYFVVGSPTVKYYYWYQVGGGGANPSLPGYTGRVIAITSSDSIGLIAQKTKTAMLVADSATWTITRLTNTLTVTAKAAGVPAVVTSSGTTNFVSTVTISGYNKDTRAIVVGDSAVGAGDSIRFVNGDSIKGVWYDTYIFLSSLPASPFLVFGDSTAATKYVSITSAVSGSVTPTADGSLYPTGFSFIEAQKGFNQQTGLKNPIAVHISKNASNAAVANATKTAIVQNFPSKFSASLGSVGDTVILTNVFPGNVTAPADGLAPSNTLFTFRTMTSGVSGLTAIKNASLIGSVTVSQGDSDGTVAQKTAYMLTSAGYTSARSGKSFTITHKIKGNPSNGATRGNLIGWNALVKTAGIDPLYYADSAYAVPIVIAKNASLADVTTALNLTLGGVPFSSLINPVLQTSGDTVFVYNRWNGGIAAPADGTAPLNTGWTFRTLVSGNNTTSTNMGGGTGPANFYIKPSPDQVIFLRKGTIELTINSDSNLSYFGREGKALTNGITVQVEDVNGTLIKALTPTVKTNAQLSALGRTMMTTKTANVDIDFVGNTGGDPFGEIPIDGTRGNRLNVKVGDSLGATPNFYFHAKGHYQSQYPY